MAEQTTWEKREEFDDGSYKEIRVKKVSNGYVKCETKHYKKDDDWKYDTVESIHEDNPMEDLSALEALKGYLKDN